MMGPIQADIYEIYSAIQGEGPYVGERQIFLRFIGCNLACDYCDTPARMPLKVPARIEQTAGHRDFIKTDNPQRLLDIQSAIRRLSSPQIHKALSLTGGEPLLYAEFLNFLLPWVRSELGLRSYLETGGVLYQPLRQIIDLVDIISMDMKLESVAGVPFPAADHVRFLRVAVEKETFVKIVFGSNTTREEIGGAARLTASVDPRITLILQPVTPFGSVQGVPSPGQTLEFQEAALEFLRDVRVIPQTHKLIEQM